MNLPFVDLGAHSNYSTDAVKWSKKMGRWRGGINSVKNILELADEMGLDYFAFTDHYFQDFSEKKVLEMVKRQREEIERTNHRVKTFITGELDFDLEKKNGFAKLRKFSKLMDFTSISLHGIRWEDFKTKREAVRWHREAVMTLVKMEEPDTIFHLFSAAIPPLDGFDDVPKGVYEEVMGAIAESGKGVEIYCALKSWGFPEPYDENHYNRIISSFEVFIREGIKAGVKFLPATDAHRLEDVGQTKWALQMIERYGATKKNIWLPKDKKVSNP